MGSVEDTNKKVDNLKEIIQRAFGRCDARQTSESDNEYIAMIAEGRLGEIPASERPRILELIASDPESAMLLKSLSDTRICSSARVQWTRTERRLAIGWAAAACLMIGLFTWKSMDTHLVPNNYRPTTPYTMQSDDPDYWSQLDQQRFASWQCRSRYRDYALILSTSATFILATILLAVTLQKSRKTNSARVIGIDSAKKDTLE